MNSSRVFNLTPVTMREIRGGLKSPIGPFGEWLGFDTSMYKFQKLEEVAAEMFEKHGSGPFVLDCEEPLPRPC